MIAWLSRRFSPESYLGALLSSLPAYRQAIGGWWYLNRDLQTGASRWMRTPPTETWMHELRREDRTKAVPRDQHRKFAIPAALLLGLLAAGSAGAAPLDLIDRPLAAWIMEWSFWAAIASMIVVPFALAGLHWLLFREDPKLATVPKEVFREVSRIVELRDFLDTQWIKLYGRAIDDFQLLRIDHALGRATVGEYRAKVIGSRPNRGFAESGMFLSLARAAAIDAELSRSRLSRTRNVNPADLIEFQKIADKEPAHRS